MNKTKIEWCDYTVNPVKGLCPMACHYCYARRMYKRYKWDETIRYEMNYESLYRAKPGSRIFWGSTMELFGDWIYPDWMHMILRTVAKHPDLTHIFLTKQPRNLLNWSPFPKNCWVGASATNQVMFDNAIGPLDDIDATVKFISFEPLLERIDAEAITAAASYRWLDWLIIGQQTPVSAKTTPRIEWVKEIVQAADKAGVPVFLKNNLRPLLIPEDCSKPNALMDDCFWDGDVAKLRQELPRVNA